MSEGLFVKLIFNSVVSVVERSARYLVDVTPVGKTTGGVIVGRRIYPGFEKKSQKVTSV